MKLISVIVPVYNSGMSILGCVHAIMKQTYQNIEVLIIDDGSDDDTKHYCDRLAEQYNKITVYHKSNGGVSDARNFGIRNAKGDHYVFIDDDDIIEPEFLEVLYSMQGKSCLPVVGIKCVIGEKEYFESFDGYSKGDTIVLPRSEFAKVYGETNFFNSVSNKLYDSYIIHDRHIRFDSNYNNGEDCLFNLTYIRYMDEISVCNRPLYNYRMSDNSLHTTSDYKRFEDIEDMYNKFINTNRMYGKQNNEHYIKTKILREYLYAIELYAKNLQLSKLERIKGLSLVLYSNAYTDVSTYLDKLSISSNYRKVLKTNVAFLVYLYFEISTRRKYKKCD